MPSLEREGERDKGMNEQRSSTGKRGEKQRSRQHALSVCTAKENAEPTIDLLIRGIAIFSRIRRTHVETLRDILTSVWIDNAYILSRPCDRLSCRLRSEDTSCTDAMG